MRTRLRHIVICQLLCVAGFQTQAFEGRITAVLTRGGETQTFTYTVGTNMLRIERNETNRPYARNLIALDTGEITLLFPHNRSFIRLPAAAKSTPPDRAPGKPVPLGIGPGPAAAAATSRLPAPTPPGHIGPTNLPGMPAMPAMPAGMVAAVSGTMPAMPVGMGAGMPGGMPSMPMMSMPGERLALKATADTTNLLGYACTRYELKQRGEIMEVWASDELFPFRLWLPNQPPRFGPRGIEQRWSGLLQARKLFPLLVSLKSENGFERLRFAVRSITPQPIEDKDGALFQPPSDYQKLEPLPF